MNSKKPTAGVILGAGMSKRLGQSKQLLKFKEKYLIQRVIHTSLQSNLNKIVLVLGKDYQAILQALENDLCDPKLEIVLNHQYYNGQSTSVKTGLLKVKDKFPSVMFLMADQPFLNSETINILLNIFWESDKQICVPVCNQKRRSPVIFSKKLYDDIFNIKGDVGALKIIESNIENVLFAEIDNELCFFDIDTKKDFNRLNSIINE